jgi:predicted amidohydrolase YtcJ
MSHFFNKKNSVTKLNVHTSMKFIFNGNILTQDKKNPTCEAILIKGKKIIATGEKNKLLPLLDDSTERIDLEGKTLMPSFVDAHIHLWKVGNLMTFTLDLRGSKSIDEILEKIKKFHLQNPDNQYINARGFNESNLVEKRMITKNDLEKLGIKKPILVQRTCAHITIINDFLLNSLINNKISFNISGGKVDTATGTLYETAQGLTQQILPHYKASEYKKMIEEASKKLIDFGVTSVCDPAVMPDLLAVYKELNQKKKLRLRLNAIPVRLPDGGKTPLEIPEKLMSQNLVVNTVKFFSDGGLSGKTAALKRTYKGSDEKGILRLERTSFYEMSAEAQEKKFLIATHAIGDDAIELVLDVYEKLYEKYKIKNRIEHLGLPDKKQLSRIKKINAYIVSQPVFLDKLGANFLQYIDNQYIKNCYPYKSILKKKIHLSFSTDAPVVKNLNPFQSIKSAITRKTSDNQSITDSEKITIEEGLEAYTIKAAEAIQMDKWIGSIKKGKCADLVILDKNPLECDVEKLTEIKVLEVYKDGKKIK